MSSELAVQQETDLALVPQFHAVAVNATEMKNAAAGIKKWLEAKLLSIDAEIVQLQDTLDAAIRHKWKSSGFKSQLQREKQKHLYYQKLLAAVHAGYTVVPNMPVDIFAIRVKRDKPAVGSAMRSETYKPSVPSLNDEQEQRLPVGEGQYKSPVQTTNVERWESKNLKNETVHHVMQTPVDFADIEFPLAVAHPVVMDATAAAMALKIFDRIGVVQNGSGGPNRAGRNNTEGWMANQDSQLSDCLVSRRKNTVVRTGRGKTMRLKSLNLKKYRVHENSTLTIGDASFVVLRGPNGGGKTSFGDALSMALANTAVSLSSDGKGFVAKIAQGEQRSIITAEIQGQHLIKHTVTLATNTSGRTPQTECLDVEDEKEAGEVVRKFKNFVGDRKSAILVATNTEYLMKLDEKGQTNLIASLVLPPRYDFPKDKVDATNGFLDTPINFEGEPFDVIQKAYKATHKERETVNRQVKEFVIPDALQVAKGVDSDSLNAELASIREQRTKLQTDRDAAVKAANETEVKRATLTTKLEGLRGEVDKGKKKLTELESNILGDEEVEALTKVAARAEELKNLKAQHSRQHGIIITLGEQISKFKDMAEAGGNCPICEQALEAEKLAVVISDFEKEYADADKKIQELDTQIEAIGEVQGAKDSLKSHEDAVKDHADLESALKDIVKTGKAARAELEALAAPTDATAPFTQPLADLQAKEDKIDEQLRPVMEAEARKKEIARLTEQLTKLQKKAATLQELVVYWDKDGVKKTLIGSYIGPFEDKINVVMDAFGCKTSLTFDPQLSFDVTTKRGYTGPIKELCGAEEEIFKRAFQCAVSIAAGIKLVVLDEMEELGIDIRPALFRAVWTLVNSGELDQAIMIEYSLDKTLPKPQAPNSRYFYVTDGTVEELK